MYTTVPWLCTFTLDGAEHILALHGVPSEKVITKHAKQIIDTYPGDKKEIVKVWRPKDLGELQTEQKRIEANPEHVPLQEKIEAHAAEHQEQDQLRAFDVADTAPKNVTRPFGVTAPELPPQ